MDEYEGEEVVERGKVFRTHKRWDQRVLLFACPINGLVTRLAVKHNSRRTASCISS